MNYKNKHKKVKEVGIEKEPKGIIVIDDQ